ncbi:MAG: AEC family transporter [Rhodobiaceae bacterium]|nr:AEC family transporter [Rhodobiaceae bacterium]MCC0016730.1 AEC family transporter [Rhodobiaceae bacterium]MCC0042155.1 AEC family transporter [Rhodobiaceae bacterium]
MLETVISIVLPVFGLVGLGFVLGRIGFFPEGTGRGLENYLYRFALPLLIFNAISKADLPDEPNWELWIAYFAGMYSAWALSQLSLRAMGHERAIAVIGGFTAAFSNMMMIGIPLVVSAFGKDGLIPFFMLVSVHLPIAALLATLMIEGQGAGGKGAAIAKTLAGLARNPILIGLAVGLVFNLGGFALPKIADQMASWIAESAVPCALVAMGLAVRRTGLGELSGALGLVTFAKLVVHPAIVYVLGHWVFDLPPLWANVIVLVAACPPGLNAYLIALPYPKAIPLASAGVSLATGLAVISVSAWLAFLLAH